MATDSTQSWEQHIAAVQAGTDQLAIEDAVCALTPLINETAERICRRHMVSHQLRLDFLADAVTEIVAPRKGRDGTARSPRIAEYDRASGPYPAWLWTVLENLLRDSARSSRRRLARERRIDSREEGTDFTQTLPDPRSRQTEQPDIDEPFCAADIERLISWPALDRVLLLVAFELWRKIPGLTWTDWCVEAGLTDLFPPDEIPRDRGEWIAVIAHCLGASRNALQNRLRRRLERLRSEPMDFIRGHSHGR